MWSASSRLSALVSAAGERDALGFVRAASIAPSSNLGSARAASIAPSSKMGSAAPYVPARAASIAPSSKMGSAAPLVVSVPDDERDAWASSSAASAASIAPSSKMGSAAPYVPARAASIAPSSKMGSAAPLVVSVPDDERDAWASSSAASAASPPVSTAPGSASRRALSVPDDDEAKGASASMPRPRILEDLRFIGVRLFTEFVKSCYVLESMLIKVKRQPFMTSFQHAIAKCITTLDNLFDMSRDIITASSGMLPDEMPMRFSLSDEVWSAADDVQRNKRIISSQCQLLHGQLYELNMYINRAAKKSYDDPNKYNFIRVHTILYQISNQLSSALFNLSRVIDAEDRQDSEVAAAERAFRSAQLRYSQSGSDDDKALVQQIAEDLYHKISTLAREVHMNRLLPPTTSLRRRPTDEEPAPAPAPAPAPVPAREASHRGTFSSLFKRARVAPE